MREGWSGAGPRSASASGAAAMSTRSCREKAQKQNEQHQAILAKLLREEDNKYCADCEAKGTAGRTGRGRGCWQCPGGAAGSGAMWPAVGGARARVGVGRGGSLLGSGAGVPGRRQQNGSSPLRRRPAGRSSPGAADFLGRGVWGRSRYRPLPRARRRSPGWRAGFALGGPGWPKWGCRVRSVLGGYHQCCVPRSCEALETLPGLLVCGRAANLCPC